MKKVLIIILALAMLIPCAYADDSSIVDVSTLEDAQLKALYVAIKEELMERKLWEESTLPAGVYQAGKALPEGAYECILKTKGNVYIYKDYEHFLDNDWFKVISLDKGQEFTLSLYESVVYLLEFDSTVRPFTGPMW